MSVILVREMRGWGSDGLVVMWSVIWQGWVGLASRPTIDCTRKTWRGCTNGKWATYLLEEDGNVFFALLVRLLVGVGGGVAVHRRGRYGCDCLVGKWMSWRAGAAVVQSVQSADASRSGNMYFQIMTWSWRKIISSRSSRANRTVSYSWCYRNHNRRVVTLP